MRYGHLLLGVALERMKVALFVSLAFLGLSLAAGHGLEDEWTLWKTRYNKQYRTPSEESVRRSIWIENFKKVELHNKAGDHSFELEMNGFADMVSGKLSV